MELAARVPFRGEGVGCFCHEAVGRALEEAFGGVVLGETDLARDKYERVAGQPELERAARWESLRNGPVFDFELPNGVTGRMSRYRVAFDVPDATPHAEAERVRAFLERLTLGSVLVEEEDR